VLGASVDVSVLTAASEVYGKNNFPGRSDCLMDLSAGTSRQLNDFLIHIPQEINAY